MTRPNLFIIGAPRCATTSLYAWLRDHPETCSSNIKETFYLIDTDDTAMKKGSNYNIHGEEGYGQYFQLCDSKEHKVIFESTPVYLYQETALKVLSAFDPVPNILVSIRKPTARVYSIFNHGKHMLGNIDEDVTFREFIALTMPEDILTENKETRDISKIDTSTFNDRVRNAIDDSIYIKHLSRWVDTLGKEQIKIYLFEDIKDKPLEVLKDISALTGLDASFWDGYSFASKNKSVIYKSGFFHKKVLRRLNRTANRMGVPIGMKLKKSYTSLGLKDLPPVSEDDKLVMADLDSFFTPYNAELSERLKVDISKWA